MPRIQENHDNKAENTTQPTSMADIVQVLSAMKLQASSTPSVFRFGDNFSDWERNTRRHLECFSQLEWPTQLTRCLSSEAEQTLSVVSLFPSDGIEVLMAKIRHILGPRGYRLDHLQKLFDMQQLATENIYQFARRLLDTLDLAVLESDTGYKRALLVDKFCLGVLSKKAKKRFREATPTTLEEALEVAKVAEMQEPALIDHSHVAAIRRIPTERPAALQMRCFICNRPGHMARECRHRTRTPPYRQEPYGHNYQPTPRNSMHRGAVYNINEDEREATEEIQSGS